MPGRDRERERDNAVGRSEFDRLQKGHDQLAAQLERVAAVAVRASSDAGEARADLQLVFFLQGCIRTKVMETLASYNSERPGILDGSRDKGPPLKCRIYEDLLAATLDQGAGQPTAVQALAALKDYPTGPAAIHSVGHLGKPREDAPWIAPVQFTGSSVGRRLRELWADPHLGCVFSKGPNGWPDLGCKPGRYRPSRATEQVCADFGLRVPGKGGGKGKTTRVSPKRSASDAADARRSRARR